MADHMDPITQIEELFHSYEFPRRAHAPDDQVAVIEHYRQREGRPHLAIGKFHHGASFTRHSAIFFRLNAFDIGDKERFVLFDLRYWSLTFLTDHIVVLQKKPKYRIPSEYPSPGNVSKYTLVFPD